MLIKEGKEKRKFLHFPHSAWSGALIKQKNKDIFTFQIYCVSKAPLSVGRVFVRDTKDAGRDDSRDGEWLGIRAAWKCTREHQSYSMLGSIKS